MKYIQREELNKGERGKKTERERERKRERESGGDEERN
jgi:hypothetical protein